MPVTPPGVYRTTVHRTQPFPFDGPDMAKMVKSRHRVHAPYAPAPELYLAHDGSGWDGTYGVILRRILDDVLNADPTSAPWPVSLMAEVDAARLMTVIGPAVSFDAGTDQIVFADHSTVDVDAVMAIAV